MNLGRAADEAGRVGDRAETACRRLLRASSICSGALSYSAKSDGCPGRSVPVPLQGGTSSGRSAGNQSRAATSMIRVARKPTVQISERHGDQLKA